MAWNTELIISGAPCLVMALLSASMQFDVSSELCRLQPTMLYGAKLLFLNKAPVFKSGSIILLIDLRGLSPG